MSDRTRLRGAYPRQEDEELTKLFFKALFGGEPSLSFPADILPLHMDLRRDAILAAMPNCDELGIKGSWAGPQHPKVTRLMGMPLGGAAGGASSSGTAGAAPPTRAPRTLSRGVRISEPAAGVEQGGGRRRCRLRNLAELEADSAFRTPPPASPPHSLFSDSDDDSDDVPLAARA